MEKIKISGVNEELYYHKLNNGLELFVVPNTNQKNYYITIILSLVLMILHLKVIMILVI